MLFTMVEEGPSAPEYVKTKRVDSSLLTWGNEQGMLVSCYQLQRGIARALQQEPERPVLSPAGSIRSASIEIHFYPPLSLRDQERESAASQARPRHLTPVIWSPSSTAKD